MNKTVKETNTEMGNLLQVISYKASAPTCWNAQSSQVLLSYQWLQTAPVPSNVLFWARVNQVAGSVQAYVTCEKSTDLSYSHDTSGENIYLCKAQAQVATGYQETITIEAAPQIDGRWDTRGYAQNYWFQL